MPALAQLQGSINDVDAVPGCAHCVLASLGTKTVAFSQNAGVTWKRHSAPTTFDEVYATRTAVFGLVSVSATL